MINKNTISYTKLFLIYSQVVVQALIINIALFYIGKGLGGFSENLITPRGQPINLASIITPTLTYPIYGALAYILLVKFTSKPLKYFKIAGYGFILIMSIGPLKLENSIFADMIILELMHLVVGIQFIEFISRSHNKIFLPRDQNKSQVIDTKIQSKITKPRTINL
jgi:Family of unknown function (DUF6069)